MASLGAVFHVHGVIRTRFFDDYLTAAIAARCHQVVLLAAGLDTRALRLAWPAGTRVFEIDLPGVLSFKDSVLAAQGAVPRCERIKVPADLCTDWTAALAEAGFDRSTPAAWLAEGLLIRSARWLQRLAEVPAVALRVIHRVAVRAVRPDRDLGNVGARRLRALPVGQEVCDRDALQLGHLAKLCRSPEFSFGGAQHDHTTVVEQQLAVPHGHVVPLVACPLGETECLNQPVHRRACVLVQQVRNDLRVWIVVWHGSHATARQERAGAVDLGALGGARSERLEPPTF
jgi:hypothetical protein